MESALQIENGLRPHVKQQVKDTEVRQKAVTPPIDLIVRTRHKVRVGYGVFRADSFAEILHPRRSFVGIGRSQRKNRMNIDQIADF